MAKMTTIGIFFFLALFWGTSFVFMRIGVPELGAPAFGGLRIGIAGLALLPILLTPKHLKAYRSNWLKLSLIGVLSTGMPFMLLSFALSSINAGTGAVINASVPMLTGIIAHLFFRDYLTKMQLLGLSIGLLGVVVLMYDGINAETQTSVWAFAMAMGACLCYAVGGNLAKRFLVGINPMTIASSGLLASGIIMLPVVTLYFPNHPVSWQAWGSVITIALFSTAIAMILFYHLIQQVGPTKTSVVTLLVPIFAILLGVMLLGEKLTWLMLLGAIIVLSGTSLTLFGKR